MEVKEGIALKVKTWVEQDQLGWYCYVGFWNSDMPHPDEEPDDWMRVGPWRTHDEAEAELKGEFRVLVMEAVKKMVGDKGGFVYDGRAIIPEA